MVEKESEVLLIYDFVYMDAEFFLKIEN